MADTQEASDLLARVIERITELEIKASEAEETLDQLNMTIYRQQQQFDALLAEVPADGGGGARNPRDELPPHY